MERIFKLAKTLAPIKQLLEEKTENKWMFKQGFEHDCGKLKTGWYELFTLVDNDEHNLGEYIPGYQITIDYLEATEYYLIHFICIHKCKRRQNYKELSWDRERIEYNIDLPTDKSTVDCLMEILNIPEIAKDVFNIDGSDISN
jgi:hypothetical protein